MVITLTLNICNSYPKESSKYRLKDAYGTRKTQILMEGNEQKTVHSCFIRGILKK